METQSIPLYKLKDSLNRQSSIGLKERRGFAYFLMQKSWIFFGIFPDFPKAIFYEISNSSTIISFPCEYQTTISRDFFKELPLMMLSWLYQILIPSPRRPKSKSLEEILLFDTIEFLIIFISIPNRQSSITISLISH